MSDSPSNLCHLPRGHLLMGRYRILEEIGQGGFATVYKAHDCAGKNRLLAIKQIHLESLSLQEVIDATSAYNREVTHLSTLRHHSLPRIYHYFMDAQHWYIAMEYLAGKSLEEQLHSTRKGYLPAKRVVDIGLALCDAFLYLHMQRPAIIFRDIKPENIILTRDGRICLIDFGIARLYRPGWKDTGPLGTPGYAAPEQYSRRAHTTPQTDIYGLGVTLQTLLTGKEPLEILRDGIPSQRAKAIPGGLQELLTHMMERDATQRPRNMLEVKQALQALKEQTLAHKIKATWAFLRVLREESSVFSGIALLILLCIDLLSLAGLVWPLLWPLSFLFLALLASFSSILVLRHKQAEDTHPLLAEEIARVIWKQFTRSISLTLLLTLIAYYIYDSPFNTSPDGIMFGVLVLGSIIAGLLWFIRHFSQRRISQSRARKQPEPELEEPLLQHIPHRPYP